jgi:hypothetical protein
VKLIGYITTKHNPDLAFSTNNKIENLPNLEPSTLYNATIRFTLREVSRKGNFKYKFEIEIDERSLS